MWKWQGRIVIMISVEYRTHNNLRSKSVLDGRRPLVAVNFSRVIVVSAIYSKISGWNVKMFSNRKTRTSKVVSTVGDATIRQLLIVLSHPHALLTLKWLTRWRKYVNEQMWNVLCEAKSIVSALTKTDQNGSQWKRIDRYTCRFVHFFNHGTVITRIWQVSQAVVHIKDTQNSSNPKAFAWSQIHEHVYLIKAAAKRFFSA